MAEYSFDTDEKQYFLISDEMKGIQVAMDDGIANQLYVIGEGFVEDPVLLDYVWPNSPKFGQAKPITEEEANQFIEKIEAGVLPYKAFKEVFGDNQPQHFQGMTWETMEGKESTVGDGMSMDEMLEALKNML